MSAAPATRTLALLLLLALAAAATAHSSRHSVPKTPSGSAEIIRDEWGVPHIYATDSMTLFKAFGYAMAEDHADVIGRLYGASTARNAEFWGEWFVELDKFIVSLETLELGESFYRKSDPWSRAILDSFAEGLNEYVAKYPEKVAPDALIVYPVTGQDVATHAVFAMQLFSSMSMLRRLFQTLQHDRAAARNHTHDAANNAPNPMAFMTTMLQRLHDEGEFEQFDKAQSDLGGWVHSMFPKGGSNAFAAVRDRGGSLLHINPHLSWTTGLMTFYEAHLVVEAPAPESDRLNFYGPSLMGMPLMSMGWNDFGGWAHTVNTVSPYSLYRLTTRAAGSDWEYLLDGRYQPFEKRTSLIKVKGKPDVLHTTLLSAFGPVVLLDRASAVVYRYPGSVRQAQGQTWRILEQTWQQMRAGSKEEFISAVARQEMPMFTYVYSNRDADLFYISNSWTPELRDGDWAKWTGPPVPTSSSADIWKNVVPFAQQPQVLNPAAGFISNANDPPYQATLPMFTPRPEDSPLYYSPQPELTYNRDFSMRPKNCFRSVKEALDLARREGRSGISAEQMIRASMVAEPESHRHFLGDLLRLARNSTDAWVRRAASVLTAWDRQMLPDSRGALLWGRWATAYLGRGPVTYTRPWDPKDPLDTPTVGALLGCLASCCFQRGFARKFTSSLIVSFLLSLFHPPAASPQGIPTSRAQLAVELLAREAQEMQEKDGFPLDLPMGEFQHLPKDHRGKHWGVSGCPGALGCVRTTTVDFKPESPGQRTAVGTWGGTFKAVVDFPADRTQPVRAWAQLAYGSASQPGHPHTGDQWQLYSERRYRQVSLDREEVERVAESRTRIHRV